MILLLDAIVLGIIVGLLLGGKLSNLSRASFVHEVALVSVLLAHVLWPVLARALDLGSLETVVVWVLLAAVLAGLALMNSQYLGMILVTVGLLLNILVVSLNGAMPVALGAISDGTLEQDEALDSMRGDYLHEPLDDDTRLSFLADVARIPGPRWHRALVSIGDLLLMIGVGGVIVQAMRLETPTPAEG